MKEKGKKLLFTLGGMILCSAGLLFVLSLLIWRLDGNATLLSGGIIAIYVITNGIGGFFAGRIMGKQKFLWGFLIGFIYFLLLCLIGILTMHVKIIGNIQLFNGAMLCVVSGMAGGMLAPGKMNK